MAPPALAVSANPQIPPAPLAGLPCRPLQAKGKACVKNIAISKFHRRGEHCSPAKALCCRKAPRVEQSPTPTMHRERVRLNFIAISQFRRRGGAWLRPPLPQRNPSIHPRTVGGPAMQVPTSKRHGLRENISQFCNFIVGASIARPLKPCAAARPLGWSRAPPLPCTARKCG